MPFVQTSDFISKSGRDLAARNAASPGGKPRTWGMLFTVTNDGTPANNTTWFLKYNQASTNLLDNSNWVTAASEFGGGGGDVTGPGSSTDNNFVLWDGTTGTVIKNSSLNAGSFWATQGETLLANADFINVTTTDAAYRSRLQIYSDPDGEDSRINLYSVQGNGGSSDSYAQTGVEVLSGSERWFVVTKNTSNNPFYTGQSAGQFIIGNITDNIFIVDIAGTLTFPLLAAPAAQTYALVVDDTGLVTSQAISGGGIGGSTGSVDNALLRADGTGGSTLQSSIITISDTGTVIIGAGTANTQYYYYGVGTPGDNIDMRWLAQKSDSNYLQFYINASSNSFGFTDATQLLDFVLSSGQIHVAANSDLWLESQAGSLYISANNNPDVANVAFGISSVADWQDMDNGIFVANRIAEPTAGIANGVAIFSADVNSSSELFTYSESGARVNITGLLTPVIEAGASFTLDETHRNKIVVCSNAGAVTVTVPSGLPLGYNVVLLAADAATTISLTTSGGASVNGTTATSTQYDTLSLVHYEATDVYLSKIG